MPSTAGVAFTTSHIAAVVMSVLLGIVWLTYPPQYVWAGAVFAGCSLIGAMLIPRYPVGTREVSKLTLRVNTNNDL